MDFVVIRTDAFTIIMKPRNNIVNNIVIHENVNTIVIVIDTMVEVDHVVRHRRHQVVIRHLATENVPIEKETHMNTNFEVFFVVYMYH